jgi:hypothetical protein
MRTQLSTLIAAALFAISTLVVTEPASAQQVTVVGPVVQINLAKDGKSAVAVLKDAKTGEAVSLTITDDLTLDKFKDKRISVGDEIRARFEKKDGRNDSKYFRKTAGC